MFKKILIANRGEIACRLIRGAQTLGIKAVAVYSEADRYAPFVELADEAYLLGPALASQSYLNIPKIIEVAKACGAEAIHPGYGFLSENPAFPKALEDVGIVFIGPHAQAIQSMGDKLEAKRTAESAGVRTIPGYTGLINDLNHARDIIEDIGYPVMVKAAYGGGGKGMRVVRNVAELEEAMVHAKVEAQKSFGNDAMFIEKFIEEPHHIEIQILADKHGNVVHLGERECSIQRKNQKVVEEAPSPFLTDALRKTLGDQAISLAKAAHYDSAGTVEFLVDKNLEFYFLEMNTRLQVEHPVTELITGIDLVEQMIRVAAGEKLSFTQEDIKIQGWAIEARVCAESADRDFAPSIGRIRDYQVPLCHPENQIQRHSELAEQAWSPSLGASHSIIFPKAKMDSTHPTGALSDDTVILRIDSGIRAGSEVTPYYDSLVCKIISYAPTRTQAIDALDLALKQTVIGGVDTTLGYLSSIITQPQYRDGQTTTAFLTQVFPEGFEYKQPETLEPFLVAGALVAEQLVGDETLVLKVGDSYYDPSQFDKMETQWSLGDPLMVGSYQKNIVGFHVQISGIKIILTQGAARVEMTPLPAHAVQFDRLVPKISREVDDHFVRSPMPGLLHTLMVKLHDTVKKGQGIAIIEAMKMENVIRAPRDGKIQTVCLDPGSTIKTGDPICELS